MLPLIDKLRRVRVVRYLFVGCSSYAIELSLLLVLMYGLQLSAITATAIAYWVGLVIGFSLQKLVAFQDYRRELKVLTKQGLGFVLLTIWNWVFTVWFVSLWNDDWVIITRSVALVIMSAWNYAIYKHALFKQPTPSTSNVSLIGRLLVDRLLWWSIGLVAGWRLVLEILNQCIGQVTHQTAGFVANLAWWANWDGGWYLSINQYGYGSPSFPDRTMNVAFFPGFPETVGAISKVVPLRPLYIGLILNMFLTVASVYLLMRLADWLAEHYGVKAAGQRRHIALLSGGLLLAFPSSFFMAAHYAEAMLVLGFVGAVYFALTKRLWLAVPFMIMASASKVTGVVAVMTVGVIVLEQWWQGQPRRWPVLLGRWAITGLGAAGLVAYAAYLKIAFNSALLFYHVEQAWGRNTGGFFVFSLIRGYYLHFFDFHHYGGVYYYSMIVLCMALPFIAFGVGAWIVARFRTFWPVVVATLIVGIPLSTGVAEGINRYCLVLAPLFPFVFIGLKDKVRPVLLYLLLGIGFVIMLGFAYGFLNGTIFAG